MDYSSIWVNFKIKYKHVKTRITKKLSTSTECSSLREIVQSPTKNFNCKAYVSEQLFA